MELYDVVKKLIGRIKPVGETTLDNIHYRNMQTLIDLVDSLVDDIEEVATRHKDSPEHSVSRSGRLADSFIRSLSQRGD